MRGGAVLCAVLCWDSRRGGGQDLFSSLRLFVCWMGGCMQHANAMRTYLLRALVLPPYACVRQHVAVLLELLGRGDDGVLRRGVAAVITAGGGGCEGARWFGRRRVDWGGRRRRVVCRRRWVRVRCGCRRCCGRRRSGGRLYCWCWVLSRCCRQRRSRGR